MKKTGKALALMLAALLALSAAGWAGAESGWTQAAENEIRVIIRLDLGEDIGLLIHDHDVNGQKGMGGSSNADRSMIRRDDTLDWTYRREDLDVPADTVEVTLRFTVVTKYHEPNFDNDYPPEDMIPMDPVSFTADFGTTRTVTITGSRETGYRAVLEEP